jgi:hypothetical protein
MPKVGEPDATCGELVLCMRVEMRGLEKRTLGERGTGAEMGRFKGESGEWERERGGGSGRGEACLLGEGWMGQGAQE